MRSIQLRGTGAQPKGSGEQWAHCLTILHPARGQCRKSGTKWHGDTGPSPGVPRREAKSIARCVPQLTSCLCVCAKSPQSCLTFVTPWTIACQAPLSIGFSMREYWSGLPCPPPGDLPHPGMEPASLRSPAMAGGGLYRLLRCSQLSAGALCCWGGPMGVEHVGSSSEGPPAGGGLF